MSEENKEEEEKQEEEKQEGEKKKEEEEKKKMQQEKINKLKIIKKMKTTSTLQDAWPIIFSKYFDKDTSEELATELHLGDQQQKEIFDKLNYKNTRFHQNEDTSAKAMFLAYIFCKKHNLFNLHKKDIFNICQTALNTYSKFYEHIENCPFNDKNDKNIAQNLCNYLKHREANYKKKDYEHFTKQFLNDNNIQIILNSNRLYTTRPSRYYMNLDSAKEKQTQRNKRIDEQRKIHLRAFYCGNYENWQYHKKHEPINDEIKDRLKEQKEQYKWQLENKKQIRKRDKSLLETKYKVQKEQQKLERLIQYQLMRNIGTKKIPADYGIKYAIEHGNEQPKKPQGHFKHFLKRQEKWLKNRTTKLQKIQHNIPSYPFKPKINKWTGYKH